MTNRTRLFLMGSATVVMVGLGVGMLAYYGGLSVAADDTVDELAYVPAEATLVAFADVQAIMQSELRKHVKSLVPTQGRGQDQFKEETGIDLEADVDRVVAASVREAGAETASGGNAAPRDGRGRGARDNGLAVITGRFDVARIEGAARQRGATVEEYKGVRVVKSSQGGGNAAIAFVKPGTVLVGDDAHVRRAIDDRAAGRSITSNAEMMRRISEAKAGANAWAVGRADGYYLGTTTPPPGLPGGLPAQLPALEWFAASGHFNGGVSATFRTEARDEQGAKNLRDVIQGVVALGRLQAGQRPEMDALLSSLQLSGSGKTVMLSFAVPGELLEKLSSQSSRSVAQ